MEDYVYSRNYGNLVVVADEIEEYKKDTTDEPFNEEFIGFGPKTYALGIRRDKTKPERIEIVKHKGFISNKRLCQQINMSLYRKLVLGYDEIMAVWEIIMKVCRTATKK